MANELKVSERLIELLEDNGINNKVFAKRINVSEPTVGRWKNTTKFMSLTGALKIVNYFNCSLEFLVGRTEKYLDYVIKKDYPSFYAQLRKVMTEKNVTRYEINKNTKISSSYFVDWKRGSDPRLITLIELADYLQVTLDQLVGREKY